MILFILSFTSNYVSSARLLRFLYLFFQSLLFVVLFFFPFFLKGEHKIQRGGSSWEENNCPSVSPLGNLFDAQYNWRLAFISLSPVSSGELPHLGGNPHSATAGGVPGIWTRGERGVKDLEIASEKLRPPYRQSSVHTNRCVNLEDL